MGACLGRATAGGMQRERAAGCLAKVTGITSIHLALSTDAKPVPYTTKLSYCTPVQVVCVPKRGPLFELVRFSDMALRHGQESQA